jgi:mannose-1-phosphate guanylyltransferase
MEKAQNVFVLCADFGWSDLGTWGSLWDNSHKDEKMNAANGEHVKIYNSQNCIVNVDPKKLVVISGVSDLIVAESDNTILICNKNDEQQIRQIVNDIRLSKGDDYV